MLYEEYGDQVKVFDKRGKSFIIDREDFELVKKYAWRIREAVNGTRYVTSFTKIDHRTILLHRLLLNADEKHLVDHINGDETDNRRSNLRLTNSSNNAKNHKKSKSNTSGFTGVYFFAGKWRARIHCNKKQISLGGFNTFEEAVDARLDAEKEYFGEFSRNTFPLAKDTLNL